jgi:predicted kinase
MASAAPERERIGRDDMICEQRCGTVGSMSRLVAVSGLPGTGKSAIAVAVARELGLVLVELDHLEAPLLRRGIDGDALGWSGYEMLTIIAEDNLLLGNGVVIDSVLWTNEWRDRCAALAARCRVSWRPIEMVCSDHTVHRARVNHRHTQGDALKSSWETIVRRRVWYEPWRGQRLVLDSLRSTDELVPEALAFIRGGIDVARRSYGPETEAPAQGRKD